MINQTDINCLINNIDHYKKTGKKLAVYPYGEYGKEVYKICSAIGVKVDSVIDNRVSQTDVISIDSLESFLAMHSDKNDLCDFWFLICTSNIDLYIELVNSLLSCGVSRLQLVDLFFCERKYKYDALENVDIYRRKLDLYITKISLAHDLEKKIYVIDREDDVFFRRITIVLQIMGVDYQRTTGGNIDLNDNIAIYATDTISCLEEISRHSIVEQANCFSAEEIVLCLSFFGVYTTIDTMSKMHANTLCVSLPCIKDVTNKTFFEKEIEYYCGSLRGNNRIKWMSRNMPHFEQSFCDIEYFSDEYIASIFEGSQVVFDGYDIYQADISSKYLNVIQGRRRTTDTPSETNNRVHLIGASTIFGVGVEDKYTVASCLQRRINTISSDTEVINYGIRGMQGHMYAIKINAIDVKKDDIVIVQFRHDMRKVVAQLCLAKGVKFYPLEYSIQHPRKYGEIFEDYEHLNHRGNELFASELFSIIYGTTRNQQDLRMNDFLKEITCNWKIRNEMESYLDNLKKQSEKTTSAGCIVMNANPFTLGHLYLVENAATRVDLLYVMVVDEDKSYYSAQDRFEMVKRGTSHLNNVRVLHSGKYGLSSFTFSEYFNKDDSQNLKISPEKDVILFAKYIAPTLGIKYRFVGEEPNDSVTRQYNEYMKKNLANYGLELVEIKRLEKYGEPISATKVRKLIREGKKKEAAKLLPESSKKILDM